MPAKLEGRYMGKRLLILTIIIVLAALPVLAQKDDPGKGLVPEDTSYAFLTNCVNSLKGISREAFSWQREDWLKVGALAYVATGLFCFDEVIYDFVQDNKTKQSTQIARLVEPLGDGKYVLPALGGLYLVGYGLERVDLKEAAILVSESYIIAGLLNHGLKLVFHRHRPSSGSGPHRWEGPSFSPYSHSFPSGHTAVAFAFASSLSEYFKEESKALPYIAYGAATLTALSRIHDRAHWPSDVFVGSLVGTFVGRNLVKASREKDRKFNLQADLTEGIALKVGYTF